MANYCGPGCCFCGSEIDPFGPRPGTAGMVDGKWSIWHDDCARIAEAAKAFDANHRITCPFVDCDQGTHYPWSKG